MTTARIEAFMDGENQTARDLWEKVEANAIANFRSDVLRWMPPEMKLNTTLAELNAGNSQTEFVAESASAEYKGYYLRIHGSRHITLNIDRLQFYATVGGISVTFKVFDALDGMQLYSQARTVTQGWNFIQLNFSAPIRGERLELFVGYDATGVDSIQTQSWEGYGCMAMPSEYGFSRLAKISTGELPTEANLSFQSYGAGLLLRASIRCGIDGFICENRQALQRAFLYKCGVEFVMESIANPKPFNVYSAEEDKEKLMELFERLYSQEIESVMAQVAPIRDGICFTCNSPIKYTSKIPG